MAIEDTLIAMSRDIEALKAELRHLKIKVTHDPLNAGRAKAQTIVDDTITVTVPNIKLIPESGLTDTVHTIAAPTDGRAIILRVDDDSYGITIQDWLNSPGTVGNINLRGTTDQVLGDIRDTMFFLYNEDLGQWMQTDLDHFLNLSDTPDTYVGEAGKIVAVKIGEDGIEFVDPGGVVTAPGTFLELTDTPDIYTGETGKLVAVNVAEDGVEFIDPPASNFLALTDTPDDYTGQASRAVKVKGDETGLEFVVDSLDPVSNIVYATELTTTNVGTGEDDLVSYELAGGVLIVAGQSLWWEAWGRFANNGNTKTVRIYWGSLLVLEIVTTVADEEFTTRGRVSRNVDGTQTVGASFLSLSIHEVNTEHSTEDLSLPIEFRISGEATSTFDINLSNAVVGLADDGTGGIVGPPGADGADGADAPDNFLDLTDTPNDYTGDSLKVVRVNTGETALEFFVITTDHVPEGVIADRNYITDSEEIKLAGIESLADVTDMANVGAAVVAASDGGAPADTDEFAINRSGTLTTLLWSGLKTALAAINNAAYVALGAVDQTVLGTKTFSVKIVTPIVQALPSGTLFLVDGSGVFGAKVLNGGGFSRFAISAVREVLFEFSDAATAVASMQIQMTRPAATTAVRGFWATVDFVGRVASATYGGTLRFWVHGRNNQSIQWGLGPTGMGITVAVITQTTTNLTLKFTLTDPGAATFQEIIGCVVASSPLGGWTVTGSQVS